MNVDLIILWGIRIGILLLLFGLLLPSRSRKTILSKALYSKSTVHLDVKKIPLVSYLDKLTEKPLFRSFMLSEESDEYQRLERLILQAGGLGGATPNIIQLFRVLLPAVGFLVGLFVYLVRVTTARISPEKLQQLIEEQNTLNSFIQPRINPAATSMGSSGISIAVIIWIFVLSLLLYFVPEKFVMHKIKDRKAKMKKELPIMETFVVIMLETGMYTVYDILKTLLDTLDFFKPYIRSCLNEYYVNPKQAIQNMGEKVNDEEFQVVCNSLKQAVDLDKHYTATFMKQHIEQLRKVQALEREAQIKKKPLIYVFLLAMPLFSIVILWLYPWFVKAMKMLSSGFF